MYDFLLLAPHAHASHSLIHYLNQHPTLHVAPYTSIYRSIEDVGAYERQLRPHIPTIGVSSKDYDNADIVAKLLAATTRATFIQVVRDPVECFVSRVRDHEHRAAFWSAIGTPQTQPTIEQTIATAVTQQVTPAFAEDAFQASSFDRHIIVDVSDLKNPKVAETVSGLWRDLAGSADVANPTFPPLGSRSYVFPRHFSSKRAVFAGRSMLVVVRLEGDLMTGYMDAASGQFTGLEIPIYTYPDARLIMPSLGSTCPLHIYAYPHEWFGVPPNLRSVAVQEIVQMFAERLRRLDAAIAAGNRAMSFTIDRLTPVQADMLKLGLIDDFEKFERRHPSIAARWSQTIEFLGR